GPQAPTAKRSAISARLIVVVIVVTVLLFIALLGLLFFSARHPLAREHLLAGGLRTELGRPQAKHRVIEEDRDYGGDLDGVDAAGHADGDGREQVGRLSAILEGVAESDPGDDAGQAEGERQAIVDHMHDTGDDKWQ